MISSLLARRLALPALLALAAACATVEPPGLDRYGDFTTTGFIREDTFQVVLTAGADRDARGLVERRESARKNAENGFADLAAGAIADYRLGLCPAGGRSAELKKQLIDSSRVYLEHGKRVAEFYREDESFVIVYRITKSGIKGDIGAPNCGTARAPRSDTHTAGGSR